MQLNWIFGDKHYCQFFPLFLNTRRKPHQRWLWFAKENFLLKRSTHVNAVCFLTTGKQTLWQPLVFQENYTQISTSILYISVTKACYLCILLYAHLKQPFQRSFHTKGAHLNLSSYHQPTILNGWGVLNSLPCQNVLQITQATCAKARLIILSNSKV